VVGEAVRLHVGCGNKRLEGWVNVDVEALPEVDVVADVRSGLDFRGVEAVFAEHFLEHLRIDEAMSFLGQAHACLADGAWLRLSTPNVDWVWRVLYSDDREAKDRIGSVLDFNRSFYAWGHRFLWNRELLREALEAVGFERVRFCAYGESELPMFRGLERHETYEDDPGLPHVLIVEAAKATRDPERLLRFETLLRERFLNHREEWELSRLRIENEQMAAKNAGLEHLLNERQREIAWMRQSRFWKLREAWWRARRRFGVAD
jgi:predicted SAM-dependent methyltransferase